ncbi:MAG: hypothetical protein LBL07_18910 [Tannerella sp.]|nr:hypothetical protein [Tannerella sp.]
MCNRKRILLAVMAVFLLCSGPAGADNGTLAREFARPGAENQPWVYWFWNNGNLTAEGIKADLEAMKRVGIGGVLIMEVGQGAPLGPVDFMGDRWRELYRYMITEAERLGIKVNMNNDAGWNGSGGAWITPENGMQKLTWSTAGVTGPKAVKVVLPEPPKIRDYYRDIAVFAFPTPADVSQLDTIRTDNPVVSLRRSKLENKALVSQKDVIDISDRMAADGTLNWQASKGDWTILRIGHTCTGRVVGPTPAGFDGLECDKLSVKAAEASFNGQIGRLADENSAAAGQGKTFVATHIDSWENGTQTWTPLMREDFRQRRGYDIWKYLPVFAGYVMDSPDVTERFLWDFRRTVSEMTLDHYVGTFRRMAHERGMQFTLEAYDSPCDFLQYGGMADVPMGEFWSGENRQEEGGRIFESRGMASAGHIYGKNIIGAEAFTSGSAERWLQHPGSMKILGDIAFGEGINRFIFHRYSFQPWLDVKPGLMMGPYGIHYERTQTWWELTPAWHGYLTRCQFMLRQGQFVADIAYMEAEDSPQAYSGHPLNGYPWDQCGADAVYRMSVKDGKLTLPGGAAYEVLVLPEDNPVTNDAPWWRKLNTPPPAGMTEKLLNKVMELVRDGATVIGKKPAGALGLTDYPENDRRVKALAAELWGDATGTAGERNYGKGRIIWGKQPEEVLAAKGIRPDFRANSMLTENHRRSAEADIYFIANPEEKFIQAQVELRATGQPELWYPKTGETAKAPAYHTENGVTRLLLPLPSTESVFVVFPRRTGAQAADPVVAISRNGTAVADLRVPFAKPEAGTPDGANEVSRCLQVDAGGLQFLTEGSYELLRASGKKSEKKITLNSPFELSGAWSVRFPGKETTFDRLISWSDSPDESIRYFSGTAVYRKSLKLPARFLSTGQRVELDLGQVGALAEVTLNGRDLGILWTLEKTIDVTDCLDPKKENVLEIRVTNLWPNRLIGDATLPPEPERKPDGTLERWPQWLLDGKPDPSGRQTFCMWDLWKKDEALIPSGLIGPVRLVPKAGL